jgi:hypothetical protein
MTREMADKFGVPQDKSSEDTDSEIDLKNKTFFDTYQV